MKKTSEVCGRIQRRDAFIIGKIEMKIEIEIEAKLVSSQWGREIS